MISRLDSVAAPGAAGSLQTLANYLTTGFWAAGGGTARHYNMADNAGVLYYNVSGFEDDADGLTAARQVMARESFKIFEEVLGIDFVETTSTGDEVDFFFTDNDSGAYASHGIYSGTDEIAYSIINVDVDWFGGISTIGGVNAYTFQTFLHEIGHGLGLGHQGNYNASASYETDAIWANDSWQQSIMSYFPQTENTSIVASNAQLISFMAADYLALQSIYGPQGFGVGNAFAGDTTWGFNTTISAEVSAAYADLAAHADTNAFCIVDGGGIDTVDFSGFLNDQVINLSGVAAGSTTGSISSVGGLTGNMTLAVGTTIENAVGGSGDDTISGNGFANIAYGGAGDDTIIGRGGTDALRGGQGDDFCGGEGGEDSLFGKGGDDILKGGAKKDVLYGGIGYDTFDYDRTRDSRSGGATSDVLIADEDGGLAFDGAGVAVGDRFDFLDLGDLNWGGTDLGSIYLRNVLDVTHCYVNADSDARAELDIAIIDGAVRAGVYTEADFIFV